MGAFELKNRSAAFRRSSRRIFTIEQANRSLPLVQRIVADVVAQVQMIKRLQRKRESLRRDGCSDRRSELDAKAARRCTQVNELIGELNDIGCQLKDWESGLVDFSAISQGREVCLCWKLGEAAVCHWHEVHEGAMGRRAVDHAFRDSICHQPY